MYSHPQFIPTPLSLCICGESAISYKKAGISFEYMSSKFSIISNIKDNTMQPTFSLKRPAAYTFNYQCFKESPSFIFARRCLRTMLSINILRGMAEICKKKSNFRKI